MTKRIKWSDPVTGLDGVIAASQAVKDGKIVIRLDSEGWVDAYGHTFNAHYTYRIGEETNPREFWVNVYDSCLNYIAHESLEDAMKYRSSASTKCIHVREVIE